MISQEQVKGIEKPWEEPEFVDKITLMQKERQMNSTGNIQFYDRSPFCTYALGKYLSHHKNFEFKPSPVLLDEIDRCLKNGVYQNRIFFFENLGFIEHTDARKISYEDALVFEQIHLNVYKEFGFEIMMVPKDLTVAQRCEFILESICEYLGMEYLGSSFIYSGTKNEEYLEQNKAQTDKAKLKLRVVNE